MRRPSGNEGLISIARTQRGSERPVLRKELGSDQLKAVFVMKTAENWSSSDAMAVRKLVVCRSWHRQGCRLGNPRTKARVRATLIVVRHPLGEDRSQMPLVERNEIIETFATRCSDQSLTKRVCFWDAGRCLQHAKILRLQYVVHSWRERAIAIMDHESIWFAAAEETCERLKQLRPDRVRPWRRGGYNRAQSAKVRPMAFVFGARFGAFEVLERLGAGGMGEVYRARDTRLDRSVALKVIRASELPDRDRLERFKREARAISRLNHPHICALYDIGEQEGKAFLVMEYVAGETLASRVERGPLRIEEVLRYGVQIAEALDTAHRNGVVHRDLKPSNIMLARDSVKLLDFGLAKLREVDADRIGNATTMSLGLSEDGLILGSLPYMAPEQLEKPVDARADLFALGVVLYEMVTGEAPFRGESKASLIVAILSQEPVPVTNRQPLTPALLDRTIGRCLAKSADERWQTAADLAAELQWIADRGSANENGAPLAVHRRRSWRLPALIGAIAAAGVTAAIRALLWPLRSVPTYIPV